MLDAVFFQHRLQRALEGGAVFAERGVIDDLGGDAGRARGCKPAGVRPVRHDQHDLGRIVLVFRRLDQRRHVGAAAGNENGDAFAAHGSPKIELAVIDDARLARGAHDFADA